MIDISKVFSIHSSRLLNFIRGRVRTIDDAKDILQEVFMRLIVDSGENDISHVSAWLYRVARNKIIDSNRKHSELSFSDLLEEEVEALMESLSDDCSSRDENQIKSIVWGRLKEALDELPEEQRQAFVKTEFEGLTFRELSERTGVPVKTLLSRKHYAVVHLRSRLRDIYDEI